MVFQGLLTYVYFYKKYLDVVGIPTTDIRGSIGCESYHICKGKAVDGAFANHGCESPEDEVRVEEFGLPAVCHYHCKKQEISSLESHDNKFISFLFMFTVTIARVREVLI